MRIMVTHHAMERAQERFGWAGSREDFAEFLEGHRGMQVGLELQSGEEWHLHIFRPRMVVAMRGQTVLTVMGS